MKNTNEIRGTDNWFERLMYRCYSSALPGIVNRMRYEAKPSYEALINDLRTSLCPQFEAIVATHIDQGVEASIIPARTMLPEMMKRHNLAMNDFGDAQIELQTMKNTCNACTRAGQCWKAMRAGTSREKCASFCPNTERLEHVAKMNAIF